MNGVNHFSLHNLFRTKNNQILTNINGFSLFKITLCSVLSQGLGNAISYSIGQIFAEKCVIANMVNGVINMAIRLKPQCTADISSIENLATISEIRLFTIFCDRRMKKKMEKKCLL